MTDKLFLRIDIHDNRNGYPTTIEFEYGTDEEHVDLVAMIHARLQMLKYDLEGQKAQIQLERQLEKDADLGF